MPKLRYVGGYRPGVDVTLGRNTDNERVVEVEHLHEIEVSGEERDQLLKQAPDDWSEVKSTGKKESD
jgi:hypothetical protein